MAQATTSALALPQDPHTNSPDLPTYIFFKEQLGEFGLRSKRSPFGNQFNNYHNFTLGYLLMLLGES